MEIVYARVLQIPYSLDIMLPFLPIRFSYKYGGGLIIVVSLIYMPPFLAVECARETAMAELSVTISCGLQ